LHSSQEVLNHSQEAKGNEAWNYLTPWGRMLTGKLMHPQLAKKFPIFIKPKASYPFSPVPNIGPYSEPDKSTPHVSFCLRSTLILSKQSFSSTFPH
jgi:hypothetical protein